MSDNILSVKNLSVVKNEHVILDDVSFDFKKGETLAIIGPNGAGKTTLLKAILGLIDYQGKVFWKKNVKVGYVPQRFYVDNDLPITSKDFFSLKNSNKKKISEVLDAVGLKGQTNHTGDIQEHILKNRLGDLSGGELQRVIIAWSLMGDPDVLLFDEPTAGVDVVGEETIYTMLAKLKVKKDMSIILISHELEIVRKFTTKVLCLNKEKVCYGPPKEILDSNIIDRLFGEEVNYFKHEHKH